MEAAGNLGTTAVERAQRVLQDGPIKPPCALCPQGWHKGVPGYAWETTRHVGPGKSQLGDFTLQGRSRQVVGKVTSGRAWIRWPRVSMTFLSRDIKRPSLSRSNQLRSITEECKQLETWLEFCCNCPRLAYNIYKGQVPSCNFCAKLVLEPGAPQHLKGGPQLCANMSSPSSYLIPVQSCEPL